MCMKVDLLSYCQNWKFSREEVKLKYKKKPVYNARLGTLYFRHLDNHNLHS